MKNNVIYLYPTQEYYNDQPQRRVSQIRKVGQIIAKAIDLLAAVGVFLCVGVCTLLFFTML